MREYRIWWGPEAYACHTITAPTAQDALVMAKVNFSRFGHEPMEIKYIGEITDAKEEA